MEAWRQRRLGSMGTIGEKEEINEAEREKERKRKEKS
jgi:hypothetical protein